MSENKKPEETSQVVLGLARVERETMQDRIYQALRERIIRGAFQPGQALKVAELAEAFGTSAMPVREALSRLTAERGVEALPNRTVRVPTLTREQLEDLRQARCAVEGLAVARAAANFDRKALAALNRLIDAQSELDAEHNSEASVEQNREFHFTIYRQAGSAILLPIIESLWLQFGPYLRYASDKYDSSNGRGTHFHALIVDGLARGDAEAARKSLEADIGRSFDLVLAHDATAERHGGAA
jgi:DNA-binding GntR family transcriptional regulator